jgi:8-oxo-dGTP pyrophosphatase MutT (NUDIX family)
VVPSLLNIFIITEKDKMQISCGFLIQSKDKYLLCHSTHPTKKANKGDGRWGIAKGGQEEFETFLEAAKRETLEEIGLNVDDYHFNISINYYTYVYTSKKKRLVVFKLEDVEGILLDFKFNCNSFTESNLPEVDSFHWAKIGEAKDLIMKSQIPVLEVREDFWMY